MICPLLVGRTDQTAEVASNFVPVLVVGHVTALIVVPDDVGVDGSVGVFDGVHREVGQLDLPTDLTVSLDDDWNRDFVDRVGICDVSRHLHRFPESTTLTAQSIDVLLVLAAVPARSRRKFGCRHDMLLTISGRCGGLQLEEDLVQWRASFAHTTHRVLLHLLD